MLPPYIIEELRRREQARREPEVQPMLDLPLPLRRSIPSTEDRAEERGVVIIELMR